MPVDSQYYQAEQEPANAGVQRDSEGRFRKGASGNPAGRPRGSRNQATLMAQELLDASAAIFVGKIIERAISGDPAALRFCLSRLLAPRRTQPVVLELPPLDTQQDLARAMAAVGEAAAAGEITPAEALEFAGVVETTVRAITAREEEFCENLRWRRERSPAAPPPSSAEA